MIHLPKQFVKTVRNLHKERADIWLKDFGALIEDCEKRWQMKIMHPFDSSYNFVAPANLQDGTEIVVKISVRGEEFRTEAEALKLFDGNGMVRLIDVDLEKSVMLLERLTPGKTLASLANDEQATKIAAQVMKKLWIPAPESAILPTTVRREKQLAEIYNRNAEGIGPLTRQTLQTALATFQLLNTVQNKPFLLHGDLHHYNILMHSREPWLAIDPKGLIGEREYDVIQFLLNNLPSQNITAIIEKRIEILAKELSLEKKRVLLWGFSHAVLATCWSIEDEGTHNKTFFDAIDVFKRLYTKHYGTLSLN